jgi:hypothetical protein
MSAKVSEFISPSIAKNLEKELLAIIGNDIKKADTSLYERKTLGFRDIIDNNFPTTLIVDYTSIKSELKQYQDIDTALKTYIDQTYQPTAKDYSSSKFSDKEIEMLVSAIRYGIKSFSQSSATVVSYKHIQSKLSDILNIEGSNNTIVSKVQQLFSKVYKLSDISNTSAEVFIFPNFANLCSLLRRHLEIGLTIAEAEAGTEISGLDSIGKILAYGHTAAGYVDQSGNTVLNFNSPKSLAIMFEVMSSSSDKSPTLAQTAIQAVTSFVTDTRQADIFISIDKDFSEGFLKLFVRAGGNIVKFENTLINSRRGSVLETREKRGVNKSVLNKLASAFTKADTTISKRLSRYILNHKKSPNAIEYLQQVLVNTILGNNTEKYGSKSKAVKSSKDKVKKQVISGISSKRSPKLPKLTKPKTVIPPSAVSLANLQNLINRQLQDVVSANMGDGDSRNVLNYRTGRLASSAKVEYMSQSRAGMITAFYSYMKNPYATFSEGGKQQNPKSRDPKLLISKSIREIAAQQVGNRLRAVNI